MCVVCVCMYTCGVSVCAYARIYIHVYISSPIYVYIYPHLNIHKLYMPMACYCTMVTVPIQLVQACHNNAMPLPSFYMGDASEKY